jgi:hypothetical protein
MLRAVFSAALAVAFYQSAAPARTTGTEPIRTSSSRVEAGATDGSLAPDARFALAATNTTLLASFSFDVGATCSQQGWTVVDGTAQVGEFWHVDDFVGANVNPGDSLAVLAGTKSLWCGLRAATNGLACSYLVLPGYGNSWNQLWQTKTCVPVTGPLDVSFLLEVDSEPGYDYVFLEYTTDCTPPFTAWRNVGGSSWIYWDGQLGPIAAGGSYSVVGNPVKVRLRFASDGGWSDEDGNFDSHAGPVVVDNLTVEGLPLEDFEDEALNATETQDWEADVVPGFGASYMALFPGSTLLQQDPCVKNLSCVWAAINGSTQTYACGGFPQQKAVPRGNNEGQYINTEIWSPSIPLVGNGNAINLEFSVYRDMLLDSLVFYFWDVRSIGPNGCEGPWRSRGFLYFGAQKDWFVNTFPAGDMFDLSATQIRVRLGVVDMAGYWCIDGCSCHSHSPLLDNVRVYRVDIVGPVWSARDVDMFQDTFPSDGSDTGIGRADEALSITASASKTILPGDSARVIVSDPITAVAGTNPSGLDTDNLGGTGNQSGTNGNKAVYLWVHVIDNGVPAPANKSGAPLSGGPQYPFKDTQIADGKTWTRIQCWLRVLSSNTFVVDLNDNLFEAGDVIEFFFGATNTSGQTSYCSGPSLNYVQSDVELAAQSASEFTILPLNGNGTFGNDMLYVDGMDGRGAQVYWDTAFEQMGLTPDRYDVRGPSSSVSNRPGTRVKDVSQQLNGNYQVILWDAGDLTQSLGDGTGAPEKSNDYAMVNSFLAGLSTPGGIYICGDDCPAGLNTAAGASAVTFKTTYITYTLTTGNHRPSYGISPLATGIGGGAFAGDTWIVFGGCPLLNDFDVMMPTGSSTPQTRYGPPAPNNDAEIAKVTGNARVMLAGFSFIYIRDDDVDGVMDRAKHLHDILTFMVGAQNQPTDVSHSFNNRLEQNYPNPFNPQTTIAFSLKQRGRVRVDVYDVAGALVKSLLDETRAAGSYTDVRWDGTNDVNQPVASGVYFYRLVAGEFAQTRKMVLLK